MPLNLDMLDEFSSSTIDPTKPSSSGPGRPAAAPPRLPAPDEDADFENQLKREMARLLSDAEPDDPSVDARNEMASEMAKLLGGGPEAQTHPMFNTLQGLSAGAAQPQPPATDGTTTDAELAEADRSFQETLRRTMERMQASGDAASTAEAKAADKGKGAVGEMGETGENELLTQLLQEMAKAGEGGEGGAGEDEEFSKLLLGMMEQLTNKEILYEPMKELDSKFPAWIKSHEGEISDGDMKRYKEQQRLVSEIVTRYDRIGYKDEDEKDREYIVERMQKVRHTIVRWGLVLIFEDASRRQPATGLDWRFEGGSGAPSGSRRWMQPAISS